MRIALRMALFWLPTVMFAAWFVVVMLTPRWKNRVKWYYIWCLFKYIVAQIIMDTLLLPHYQGEAWFETANLIIYVFLIIGGVLFFYWIFEDGILCCYVASIICEVICVACISIMIVMINYLEHHEELLVVDIPVTWPDLLALPFFAALFCLFYRMVAPLLRKFRTYEIRHKRIVAVCFAVNVVAGINLQRTGSMQVERFADFALVGTSFQRSYLK